MESLFTSPSRPKSILRSSSRSSSGLGGRGQPSSSNTPKGLKVVVLGGEAVGKSSLVATFLAKAAAAGGAAPPPAPSSAPSVGLDITTVPIGPCNGKDVCVHLWEVPFSMVTSGAEAHLDLVFSDVDGIAIVFDVTSAATLGAVDACRDLVASRLPPASIPLHLLANKQDKPESCTLLSAGQLGQYAEACGYTAWAWTSCVSDGGVSAADSVANLVQAAGAVDVFGAEPSPEAPPADDIMQVLGLHPRTAQATEAAADAMAARVSPAPTRFRAGSWAGTTPSTTIGTSEGFVDVCRVLRGGVDAGVQPSIRYHRTTLRRPLASAPPPWLPEASSHWVHAIKPVAPPPVVYHGVLASPVATTFVGADRKPLPLLPIPAPFVAPDMAVVDAGDDDVVPPTLVVAAGDAAPHDSLSMRQHPSTPTSTPDDLVERRVGQLVQWCDGFFHYVSAALKAELDLAPGGDHASRCGRLMEEAGRHKKAMLRLVLRHSPVEAGPAVAQDTALQWLEGVRRSFVACQATWVDALQAVQAGERAGGSVDAK